MGYINIYIKNGAHVSVKNEQLVLENETQKIDYPLEDISSVMIENLATTISTYALSKFSENGILVFVCNQNHLPCGIILPFCEHYHSLSQYQLQCSLSKPLEKQLWQTVVKNKIKNQNEVLNICGGADDLKSLYSSVASGDSGNNEAKASLIYFKKLFGKDFARREENAINSCLNYGYSIVRGFVARSVVVHGFMPFLGINHHNQYNAYNLADDLMEVFRPIVDLYVKIYLSDKKELTPEIKREIFGIVNYEMEIDGQKHSLDYVIEIYVQSFLKSLKTKTNCLKDVQICGLEIHKYE